VSLEVSVKHQDGVVRVLVKGEASLGRLLSLLQVLEVDAPSWPAACALLDLRPLQARLACDEQARFAWEVARALRRMKRVALLAPRGRLREAAGVRVFDDEQAAQHWLAGGS
jgi:hypothetical protein